MFTCVVPTTQKRSKGFHFNGRSCNMWNSLQVKQRYSLRFMLAVAHPLPWTSPTFSRLLATAPTRSTSIRGLALCNLDIDIAHHNVMTFFRIKYEIKDLRLAFAELPSWRAFSAFWDSLLFVGARQLWHLPEITSLSTRQCLFGLHPGGQQNDIPDTWSFQA